LIPLVDLRLQYMQIRDEIDTAIDTILANTNFIGGKEVSSFEAEYAAFCETKACVGVANGTDALYLTLRALGIGPGDEVITVAHTFIATAEAISLTGAQPVFVDVCPDTLLMDPNALESAINPHSRAVIPVHLYGQSCEMDLILEMAHSRGLKVIEDAAQAHGARWQGRRVGSIGDVACFSFYPGKNLGAYGDGGAVVSQDQDLIHRIRMLANHGRREKYTHEIVGVNSRLDSLQAAILRVKLHYLETWNASRRLLAAQYFTTLSKGSLVLPVVRTQAEPVWHLFVVRSNQRDHLQEQLRCQGVETGIHYPLPLHLQPAYQYLGLGPGTLPVSEQAAGEVLSLPMYAELTTAQVDIISQIINTALA
jgi:dTDP-4-amino-4,6-dideoxygalactose transaminase